MPDGCITLVINLFEDETRLYDPEDMSKVRKFNGCSVSGPHTKCFAIDTDEQTCVIGISFRPAGAVPFLKLPSDELHNQHVGLDDLWDASQANCANAFSQRQHLQRNYES
jgi:hypothetical protein